jgi:hypothetical protein
MLYAVVDQSGELIARDLTTEQAAHEILTVDGQEYEIRPDSTDGYWTLRSRKPVSNKPWTAHLLIVKYGTEDEARAAIFAHVVAAADGGRWWKAEAIPQEEYDEMVERLRAEAEASE